MKAHFVLIAGLIASCAPVGGPSPVRLRLRFPQTLLNSTPRWENFLSRAIQMEITVGQATFPVAPGRWETIDLPHVEPPPVGESLLVQVRVWDRDKDGLPRRYPVATGHAKVTAANFTAGTEVPLRLELQVSVKDYD